MSETTAHFRRNLSHYLFLFIILDLGIGAFYWFRYQQTYQVLVISFTGLAYVLWGIIHHWLEGDLHPKVIIEYLLFALLVIFLISILILRA